MREFFDAETRRRGDRRGENLEKLKTYLLCAYLRVSASLRRKTLTLINRRITRKILYRLTPQCVTVAP
jgi:hypothetical protein